MSLKKVNENLKILNVFNGLIEQNIISENHISKKWNDLNKLEIILNEFSDNNIMLFWFYYHNEKFNNCFIMLKNLVYKKYSEIRKYYLLNNNF